VAEPPAASVDLARLRLLVDAPFAPRLVLEVLHRIGDVDLVASDAGSLERAVEHLAGGPHERTAGQILLVAWLLADEHERGIGRPFAEDGVAFL
jgi:hypothetical protein